MTLLWILAALAVGYWLGWRLCGPAGDADPLAPIKSAALEAAGDLYCRSRAH